MGKTGSGEGVPLVGSVVSSLIRVFRLKEGADGSVLVPTPTAMSRWRRTYMCGRDEKKVSGLYFSSIKVPNVYKKIRKVHSSEQTCARPLCISALILEV